MSTRGLTGLVMKAKKTIEIGLNTTSNIKIDAKFTYLETVVSTGDTTQKIIKSRIAKAQSTFQRLPPIWKCNQYIGNHWTPK